MASTILNGNVVEHHTQQEGGEYFAEDAAHSNYILLQCTDRLDEQQLQELERHHVRVLQTLVGATYLCRYEPTELSHIKELPFVVYANVYHSNFVIHSSLNNKLDNEETLRNSAQNANRPSKSHKVLIILHEQHGQSVSSIRNHIANLLHLSPADFEISEGRNRLSAKLSASQIRQISALDEVQSIVDIKPLQSRSIPAVKDLKLKVKDYVHGSGELHVSFAPRQIIAVADNFIDKTHPAFAKDRIIKSKSFLKPDDKIDYDGHGTAMAACAAGRYRALSEYMPETWIVTSPAPDAKIYSQTIYSANDGSSSSNDESDEVEEKKENNKVDKIDKIETEAPAAGEEGASEFYGILNDAFNNGAFIHSNSTGTNPEYNEKTQEYIQDAYDVIATDIDTFVNKHQHMVVVFAAGNESNDDFEGQSGQIGGPATAKNAIVVGATESSQRSRADWLGGKSFNVTGIHPSETRTSRQGEGAAGLPSRVGTFSNRGPVKGCGRVKPDVLAPGTAIYTARSTDSTTPFYYTKPDDLIKEKGYKEINQEGKMLEIDVPASSSTNNTVKTYKVTKDYDRLSMFVGGTSPAAAFVSGCCAVIRERVMDLPSFRPPYNDSSNLPPSAAIIKAILVNGAQDVSKERQRKPWVSEGVLPDNTQGFGLVNMARSLRCITDGANGLVAYQKSSEGSIRLALLEPPVVTGQTLKNRLTVTMSYLDTPSSVLAGGVTNCQLQLTLTDSNNPPATKTAPFIKDKPDGNNNTQRIIWTDPKGSSVQAGVIYVTETTKPNWAIAAYVDYEADDASFQKILEEMYDTESTAVDAVKAAAALWAARNSSSSSSSSTT